LILKQDRITKLYANLDNKQRATLAFRYLTDVNKLELKRVVDSVPSATYIGPDIEYRRCLDGIFDMASLWALLHWQVMAHFYRLRWAILVHVRYGENEEAKMITEKLQHTEARVMALENAMVAVCDYHGIDPDAVRKLAQAEPFVPTLPDQVPDANYQANIQAALTQILETK
jgi:hypothetical protein